MWMAIRVRYTSLSWFFWVAITVFFLFLVDHAFKLCSLSTRGRKEKKTGGYFSQGIWIHHHQDHQASHQQHHTKRCRRFGGRIWYQCDGNCPGCLFYVFLSPIVRCRRHLSPKTDVIPYFEVLDIHQTTM